MIKNVFRLLTPAILFALFATTLTNAQVRYNQQGQCANPNNSNYGYQQGYYNDYQPKRPIYERIQNQRNRVAEGLRDGTLTRSEADRLQKRMSQLQLELNNNSRNEYVSNSQVNRIQSELDSISEQIYRARHNGNGNYNYNNGYGNNGYNYGNGNYNNNGYYRNNGYNNPNWRNR